MAETLLFFEEIPEIGIRKIDADHEDIVRCVNELHAGMLARVGREALNERLAELLSRSKAHFGTEDALMREHGYPDYPAAGATLTPSTGRFPRRCAREARQETARPRVRSVSPGAAKVSANAPV